MDPAGIAAAITPRTKAIVPVHLFGHPADMDPILEIARRHGLVVIEDACQAHAAEYKGRRVGAIGDIGCFSFYPGKNLGALRRRRLRDDQQSGARRAPSACCGTGAKSRRYHHILRGYNYRMEGLQGAILRVKLRHLEAWTEARRSRARVYARELEGTGVRISAGDAVGAARLRGPRDRERISRWDIQRDLAAQGIQTAIHYPEPIHLMAPYRDPAFPPESLPHAERVARADSISADLSGAG